jgi:hypothetical protein
MSVKKTTAKKAVVKKKPAKKVAVKKTVAKKAAPKKVATKKVTVQKIEAKKPIVKKTAVKKTIIKKVAVTKAVVKKAAPKKQAKKPVAEVKQIKDISEELILTKYETGAHYHYPEYRKDLLETEEPPCAYDINRVVILPVDPTFAFLYWEVREDTLNSMFQQFGYDSKLTVRIYDVTNVEFNGLNANEWWDVEVYNRIGTWYLKHFKGDRNLVVDIGVLSSDGNYHVIHRSKTIYFPRDAMVAPGKTFWMLVDEFGNKVISEIEDFTEEDMRLLRLIMGDDKFKRFMKGGLDIFLGGSAWGRIPAIENFINLANIPSSRSGSWSMPSSSTRR